jgi:hypothetical protein
MKKILSLLAALAAFALPTLSHAEVISGDISGGGLFNGSVTRANAWVEENPVDGQEVNFWTFSGHAGDKVSFTVTSDVLEFGMSLYQGALEEFDLIVPGFENTGDFASLFFVAGTPDFGGIGTELLSIVLPTTGAYVLAIGGEGFGFGDSYGYHLDASFAPVPVPAAVWLFGSALMGLAGFRRRRAA